MIRYYNLSLECSTPRLSDPPSSFVILSFSWRLVFLVYCTLRAIPLGIMVAQCGWRHAGFISSTVFPFGCRFASALPITSSPKSQNPDPRDSSWASSKGPLDIQRDLPYGHPFQRWFVWGYNGFMKIPKYRGPWDLSCT